jgi:zinc D-Ala-D-Ala carboxypeptidase
VVSDWSKYPNFNEDEFNCKHSGKNDMQDSFMEKLQQLRTAYGKPMTITSGYRHWSHPVELKKGHKNGEHTKGLCCDVAVTNSTDRFNLIKLALELGFTRIGFHTGFLHLGIGDATLPNNVFWHY